jgi:hypothetical protein
MLYRGKMPLRGGGRNSWEVLARNSSLSLSSLESSRLAIVSSSDSDFTAEKALENRQEMNADIRKVQTNIRRLFKQRLNRKTPS